MTSNQIKVAVVGGGAFGECHLRTYRSMSQVEIAGVCTLDPERAKVLCERYGGIVYPSVQAIAADPGIDLVSIVTPEDAHVQPFQMLANAGKAIYVEKPLATSPDDAKPLLEASQFIIAMSGHCLRFESRFAYVFQQRDTLGQLRHMSFKIRRTRAPKQLYGRVHPAYVLLCHGMELANAFAGVPFKRVCAIQSAFDPGQINSMSLLIEYENGASCVIEGGWILPDQSSVSENDAAVLDFDGGTFSIHLPHDGFRVLAPGQHRFINQHYEHSVYGMERGALRNALEYMVGCVKSGTNPTISTIADGFNAVSLVEASIRAAETGAWVHRGAAWAC